jgi:signal recognition particle receptor subunit alpha
LGGSYTIKWLFNNSLGLIYVAVYQKALKLTYIDELLRRVDKAFCQVEDVNNPEELQIFDGYFVRLLREIEEKNDDSKKADTTRGAVGQLSREEGSEEGPPVSERQQETRPETVETSAANAKGEEVAEKDSNGVEDASNAAFNAAILSKKFGKKPGQKKQEEATKKKATSKEKKARSWSSWGTVEEKVSESELDFTDGVPPAKDKEAFKETFNKMSLVDMEEDVDQEGEGDVHEDSYDGQKSAGLLSSFVRNLGVSVLGTQALTHEDIDSSLQELKRKLMERNVAEEIANK